MKQYEIVQEELRNLPKEACLIDFIGELYEAKKEENVIFTLSSEAFRKMCAFLSKKGTIYATQSEDNRISIEGISFDWATKKSIVISTTDKGKTYVVEEISKYTAPPKGSKVTNYIIE